MTILGKPPRLSRRERVARLLVQVGRYWIALWVTVVACYWAADVHMFVPCLVIAAMVANPMRPKRPKRPVRPAHAGTGSRAIHSGPGAPPRWPVRRRVLPVSAA